MDVSSLVGKHIGRLVEKAVVNALSGDDKDDDDKDKRGGIFSLFGGDKDDDKDKDDDDKDKRGGIFSLLSGDKDDDKDKDDGGLFSFGRDEEKKKDDDDGGFFSRLLNRDDDDDKQKKSGFKGLFNEEQGAAGCDGGQEGEVWEAGGATFSGGGGGGGSCGINEGDLLSDLMDVAEEHSQRQ